LENPLNTTESKDSKVLKLETFGSPLVTLVAFVVKIMTNSSEELVTFFKALADKNRLKIVGLLAEKPYSVEELATLLGLKPPTISHHLAKLVDAGLVTSHTESYYSVYQLDQSALETKTRSMFSQQDLSSVVSEIDADAYDKKVIKDYGRPDGSLKTLPSQRKKLEAILRYVVKAFDTEKRYSEKQVNEILARYHADTATLRRELVGFGLMQREGGGGEYWRM
jgi:predicted transcriptional regulator